MILVRVRTDKTNDALFPCELFDLIKDFRLTLIGNIAIDHAEVIRIVVDIKHVAVANGQGLNLAHAYHVPQD